MADIDKITVGSTTYNVKDATARESISQMTGTGAFNCNDKTDTGIFFCSSSATNQPVNGVSGMLICSRASASWVVQIFISAGYNTNIYRRQYVNSAWSDWAVIS